MRAYLATLFALWTLSCLSMWVGWSLDAMARIPDDSGADGLAVAIAAGCVGSVWGAGLLTVGALVWMFRR